VACYTLREAEEGRAAIIDPVIGVVYHPVTETLYHAMVGRGAYENRRRISINGDGRLESSIACVALTSRSNGAEVTSKLAGVLIERALKVRSFGATALDSSLVATGSIGAFVQRGTNLWDFGAAKVIVEEAGGFYRVSKLSEGKYKILAGSIGLRDELEELVEEVTGESWKPCDLSL
jgi:fructose-1,6-bisphosphatase/inositol monophosphatase family enzyme